MVKSGFFYWPKTYKKDDDTCVCFQCGLALDNWEEDDDPMYEHSKRRPDCPFVKNRIAIQPYAFNYLLGSKADLPSIRHYSASAKESKESNMEKFQVPQIKKSTNSATATASKRSSSIVKSEKVEADRRVSTSKPVTRSSIASSTNKQNESKTRSSKRSSSIAPVQSSNKSSRRESSRRQSTSAQKDRNNKLNEILSNIPFLLSPSLLNHSLIQVIEELKNRKLIEFDSTVQQLSNELQQQKLTS